MSPLTVIPHFDEFEDGPTCFSSCRQAMISALGFQRGTETRHHGIVIAVAGAAHARGDLSLGQQRLIIATGVLIPIRVVQQFTSMGTLPQ